MPASRTVGDGSYSWLRADVTWSDGDSSLIDSWNTTWAQMEPGAGSVKVLRAGSLSGNGETVAVAFRSDGAYVNAPDTGSIPLGMTYDLVPFAFDDPGSAGSGSMPALEGLTFTLGDDAGELTPDERTELWADENRYYVASFTAQEAGGYYAQAESAEGDSRTVDVYTADGEGKIYSQSQSGTKPSFSVNRNETVILAFRNDDDSRKAGYLTVSRKPVLERVSLTGGEGSVFDVKDEYYRSPAAGPLALSFVYGEGEEETAETISLSDAGVSYDYIDDTERYYYSASGPYGESVRIDFYDGSGNQVSAPVYNDGLFPEAGSYTARATVSYTDPQTGEQASMSSNEAQLTLSDSISTQFSLSEDRSYTLAIGEKAIFAYTAQKAGVYEVSIPGSNISEYQYLVAGLTQEGRYRRSKSGYIYNQESSSSAGVSVNLEAGERLIFVLTNRYYDETGTGTIRLTSLRNIESVSLSADPDKAFDSDTLYRSRPSFLTASYSDDGGNSGVITDWTVTYITIDDNQYRVLEGSGEGTESIDVVFSQGGSCVDYPFEDSTLPCGEYTLQAFRRSALDEIDAFAAQNPDAAVTATFDVSSLAKPIEADQTDTGIPSQGKVDMWYSFTAPEEGSYSFTTGNWWCELCLYQKAEDGEGYVRSGNGSYRLIQRLSAGEELVIHLTRDNGDGDEERSFTVTQVKNISSLEVEDVTVAVPSPAASWKQMSVRVLYDGEETAYEADEIYPESWAGYLYAYGRYGEEIRIYFRQNGETVSDLSFMGADYWPEDPDEPLGFRTGEWTYFAEADVYDPEQEEAVVASEEKTLTQTAAEFDDMAAGDGRAFILPARSGACFRFNAEAMGRYRYMLGSDSDSVQALLFTQDEDGTYNYQVKSWLYENEDPEYPDEFETRSMEAGESVFVVLYNNREDRAASGTLYLDLDSDLDPEEIRNVTALKDGYRSAITLENGETRYYSFTPDPDAEGMQPGRYTFTDDFTGEPNICLYYGYGASWILQDSIWYYDTNSSQISISYEYEEGREYIIAVAEDGNGGTGYIYFNSPQKAESYTINNMPSEASVLTLPAQMRDVSVTVKTADGRTEEITGWRTGCLYGNYQGRYYDDEYHEYYVLSAQSSLTGQNLYLAAFAPDGSTGILANNYDNYSEGTSGEYEVHLLTRSDDEESSDGYTDLTAPTALTITAPSPENTPMIVPDEGRRSAALALGQTRVYRLDVSDGSRYRLQTDGEDGLRTLLYQVSADEEGTAHMFRFASLDGSQDCSWTASLEDGETLYAVAYADYEEGTLELELTETASGRVRSAELTANWQAPVFIEDMYWRGTMNVASQDGITASLTYEDEALQAEEILFSDGAINTTDSFGNELSLCVYRAGSDGTLSYYDHERYYDELPAGDYYAVLQDGDGNLIPAPGRTISGQPRLSDVSAIGFRVLSRKDAASGHVIEDGQITLESTGGYYAGALYTAEDDGTVIFRSPDRTLEYVYVYDAQGRQEIEVSWSDDDVPAAVFEKGKTYQIFARPGMAGTFTLETAKTKNVTRAVVGISSDVPLREGDYLSSGVLYTDAFFEDGTSARFYGTEEDTELHRFIYRIAKAGEDPKAGDGISEKSLSAGTWEVQAQLEGTDLFSENTVTVHVAEDASATDTLEPGRICTRNPGEEKTYVFTPQEDGYYSVLENGEIAQITLHEVMVTGETRYIESAVGDSVYSLKAGRTYRFSPQKSPDVCYYSVTKRTPLKLTSQGLDTTLAATPDQAGYLLFETDENIMLDLQIDAQGQGSVSCYASIQYGSPRRGTIENSGYLWTSQKSAVSHSGIIQAVKGNLYQLSLTRSNGQITGYRVRMSKNDTVLTKWEIVNGTSDTTDLPRMLSYYYRDHLEVRETFSDGSTQIIIPDQRGVFGEYLNVDQEWTDYEAGKARYTVSLSGTGESRTLDVRFRTDYSVYPELPENTPRSNGLNADGVYIYRFTPSSDSRYSVSLNTSNYYYEIFRVPSGDDEEDDDNISASEMRKGSTYLICIRPDNANAQNEPAPTVTVVSREDKTVSGIRITKAPDVVLPQSDDYKGMTAEITYSEGGSGTVTFFNSGAVSDAYGNVFQSSRALLPGNGTGMYRYTVYTENGQRDTYDASLTSISALPQLATDPSSALSDGLDTLSRYGSASKWYRFTPAESGMYGTGVSISNSETIGYYETYARFWPADSTELVYYPYELEKGKTYVVRQISYSQNGGTIGLYAIKLESADTVQASHAVTYRFEAKGGGNLPAAVTALLPEKKVLLQNAEVDLAVPAAGDVVGADGGYWIFEGYTPSHVTVGTSDVTVTGTWAFAPSVHRITYAFASSDTAYEIPEELKALAPDEEEWGEGMTAELPAPSKTEFETIEGVWTFQGWHTDGNAGTVDSVTVGTSDVTVTGIWSYTEEKHSVSYRFVSSTSLKDLPKEVTDLTPEKVEDVVKGSRVALTQPARKEVEDTAGRWIFTGYDVNGAVTVRGEDVVITGTWTYITEIHTVNYAFISADGSAVDAAVLAYLPAAEKDVTKGTVVTAAAPAKELVESEHGSWEFDGYDKESVTVGNDDVTFTGTWTYVPDIRTVHYEFVSDDKGTDLPPEVTALTPEDHEETRGTEVTPKQPSETAVESGGVTWRFLGYEPQTVTIARKNVTFTGSWTCAEVHTVSYRFVSGTDGASFADDAAAKQAIDAHLPAEETVKKGDTITLLPAQGTTVPAASGAWVFGGYTTAYTEGETPAYITEWTAGSEDQELTGVWTFNEKTVQVTYRFVDETGKEITDRAVTAYLPDPVTLVKGKTHTPVSLAGTTADAEHGVWTFRNYDKASVTAGDEDIVITITGTWAYAEVTAKVNYTYQSTGAQTLPDGIEEATGKPESADLRMGDSLTLASPSKTTFDDIHGTWIFKGWHPEGSTQTVTSVTGGKTDTKVVGDWEYQEIRKTVSYQFKVSEASDPAGLALPGSITAPAAHEVRKGDPMTAVWPDPDEVKDTTGTWTFDGYEGYDPNNPPAMGTENVTLTGTWTHRIETHTVEYAFRYTNDNSKEDYFTAAMAEIGKQMPVPQTLTKGDPVHPLFADGNSVETAHGSWTFAGYEGTVPTVVGEDDITIIADWIYRDDVHQVIYADFECEDENGEICGTPDEIAQIRQELTDTRAVRGETVKPAELSEKEITIGSETWYFGGYKSDGTMVPESGILMGSGDITFTGIWSRQQKYTISYRFESGTAGMSLPEQVTALLAELQPQTGNKGSSVTLYTEADLSETHIETPQGIWEFTGFVWSGEPTVTLTENLGITGTWVYSPEGETDKNLTWKIEEDVDGDPVLTIDLQEGADSGEIPDYSSADPAPWSEAVKAYGVRKISVAEGITKIGENAFAGINPVEQADLPRSLEQIADNAFEEGSLSSDTKVNYAGTEAQWADLTKDNPALAGTGMTSTHEHTWEVVTVTAQATEESEGSRVCTCSVCGETMTEVIPKIVLPETIKKVPAGFKAKAAKKGKVNLTWKKFKQTKKTKKIWKLVKKIEIQYSTDPTFKTGKVSKLIGKTKTKYTVKKLVKGAKYYFRIRYIDGKGGVSKWSKMKSVKVK